MKIIGLVSTYREGGLARMAIESAQRACDHVIVFEGPAGDERCPDAPETDPAWLDEANGSGAGIVYREGVWTSDAVKRTAMVKATRGYGDGPIWGVWVDGDEVLENGDYLRDQLAAVGDRDEAERVAARLAGEAWQPRAGLPIRIVEADGSVAVCRAKVVRVDLIDQYVVSSSGIRFKNGVVMAEGNLPQSLLEWWGPRQGAIEQDRLVLEPPLPGEPFLVHRSHLRHPARRALRMHEQEARELDRLGFLKAS